MAELRPHIDSFKRVTAECPLPPAVELIGEKWAVLIIRGAVMGLRHFEEFQAGLGIARNILSDRLTKLVAGGVLDRRHDPLDRRKVVYRLTRRGEALLPVLVALRQWGEEWGNGGCHLIERRNGKPIQRLRVRGDDGRELGIEDIVWIEDDGEMILPHF
ncbi:transcriptional regulator [Sphingomonas ginkgonis]|uniref:Transcriptional regulator n=1 Tax=Sphingomonas ginkgonis TaxID=2315330 RepID=A0A429V6X1_9SPHN|nr:helix-turn-helix domain-containing protein [Sphingomonas ginkgonis]RST29637.1 transcriptional regulator [Sphingomonas ginkgonis]